MSEVESVCEACNKRLGRNRVTSGDFVWHSQCFKCNLCEKDLGGQSFHRNDTGLWCLDCFDANVAPKCHKCDGVVKNDGVVVNSTTYHQSCVKCGKCEAPLDFIRQVEDEEGKKILICIECYKTFEDYDMEQPKSCGRCLLEFGTTEDPPWQWEDKHFHPGCFNCLKCNVALGMENLPVAVDGQPHCQTCAR